MLNRRELLQRGATVAAGTLALGRVPIAWGKQPPVAGMNIVLFITDQERAIQHFPRGWSRRHLPGFTRLQRNGLRLRRVLRLLHVLADARDDADRLLPGAARREVHARGEHGGRRISAGRAAAELQEHRHRDGGCGLQRGLQGQVAPQQTRGDRLGASDVDKYGFTRWSPPDAGANQDLDQTGGGDADNDGRFMNQTGSPQAGQEGALQYLKLRRRAATAVLPDRLTNQPARRAAVPEELPQRRDTTTRG